MIKQQSHQQNIGKTNRPCNNPYTHTKTQKISTNSNYNNNNNNNYNPHTLTQEISTN